MGVSLKQRIPRAPATDYLLCNRRDRPCSSRVCPDIFPDFWWLSFECFHFCSSCPPGTSTSHAAISFEWTLTAVLHCILSKFSLLCGLLPMEPGTSFQYNLRAVRPTQPRKHDRAQGRVNTIGRRILVTRPKRELVLEAPLPPDGRTGDLSDRAHTGNDNSLTMQTAVINGQLAPVACLHNINGILLPMTDLQLMPV